MVKNGSSYEINGWKYISIKGSAKERGYAYGYLCAKDFKEIQKMLEYHIMESYGETWEWFIENINASIKEKTKNNFFEIYEEMEGISEGLNAAGTKTTLDEIIAWNFYMSIPYWHASLSPETSKDSGSKEGGGSKDKCSAFIACGDYTEDGEIVVAHNSFEDFIDGQYANIVLDIYPSKGNRIIMQTSPCWIWSGTDFFITSKGIIGTETTIGGFKVYENNFPIGYRIRKAMQYGNSLDDYVNILLDGNSGDYANSWLFGDTNTNEILRIELGLRFHNIERTKNGYFIGFNAAYDPKIRLKECSNSGFYDIRRHQGARKVRLTELMNEHKGKLNIEIAKKIISDHYDVYLHKEDNPCSRTVCSHYDLDQREYMSQENRPKPFAPHGAIDGFVTDSKSAKKMTFYGRFGNSCGIPFLKDEYCDKHIQFDNYRPYLKDRPTQPWTAFTINKFSKKDKVTTYKKNKTYKKTNNTKKNRKNTKIENSEVTDENLK